MTAPARSVFAEPLAQAREALRAFRNVAMFESYPESIADDGLAALDLIEQKAGEMEAEQDALAKRLNSALSYRESQEGLPEGTLPRASLSAREEAS